VDHHQATIIQVQEGVVVSRVDMVNLIQVSILLHQWVELPRVDRVNLIIQLSGRNTTDPWECTRRQNSLSNRWHRGPQLRLRRNLRCLTPSLITVHSGQSTTEALAKIRKPRPLRLRCELKLVDLGLDQASLEAQVLNMVSLSLDLVTINLSRSLHTIDQLALVDSLRNPKNQAVHKSSTILPGKIPKILFPM